MPKALVCINTDFFGAEDVLNELEQCKEVEEAFRIHGAYEVIAKIHGKTTESLLDTVTRHIKRIHGVQTVHTMLIIESEKTDREKRVIMV